MKINYRCFEQSLCSPSFLNNNTQAFDARFSEILKRDCRAILRAALVLRIVAHKKLSSVESPL